MALPDMIVLIVGMALILIAIQTLIDKHSRSQPRAVVRAVFTAMAGVFLMFFWYKTSTAQVEAPPSDYH